MRLVGNVKITDYMRNVLIQNRDSVTSLYSAQGEDILQIVNPHVRRGFRYKVSAENVLQASVGGLFRDRLIILLNEPPHEVEVYSTTILLERFGNLMLRLCHPVGPPQLVVPLGFPRELESVNELPHNLTVLKLHHMVMDCLPQELARLQNITHLEVVNCNLKEVPAFIGDFPNLSVLILSRNKLGAQQNWIFLSRPHIRQNLNLLDLQCNELKILPNEVTGLHELAICLLDDNQLASLPTGVRQMHGLRILTVSNNRMRIFPYNLFPLSGFALDLSKNPFTSRYFVIQKRPQNHMVPTLKELAARATVDYRLPVSTNSLPKIIVEYLREVEFCAICSGAYFETSVACRYMPTFRVYSEVLTENEDLEDDDYILKLCSRRCMQPELKFCELLSHLTPEQYDDWIKDLC